MCCECSHRQTSTVVSWQQTSTVRSAACSTAVPSSSACSHNRNAAPTASTGQLMRWQPSLWRRLKNDASSWAAVWNRAGSVLRLDGDTWTQDSEGTKETTPSDYLHCEGRWAPLCRHTGDQYWFIITWKMGLFWYLWAMRYVWVYPGTAGASYIFSDREWCILFCLSDWEGNEKVDRSCKIK